MSNTVRIRKKKKKNQVKVNYKLWAVVFGVFVALIITGSVWAAFHWGVGFGSAGGNRISPEDAAAAATDIASDAASDIMVLTPEDLEGMGIPAGDMDETDEQAEGETDPAVEAAAEESGAEDAESR